MFLEQDGSQTTSITRDYRLTTHTHDDSNLNIGYQITVSKIELRKGLEKIQIAFKFRF